MIKQTRALLFLAAAAVLTFGAMAAPVKPPENPAKITIQVAPESVSPGGEATVTLTLDPISGIKINRYPKIKLRIPAQEGLIGEAEAAIGNEKPPPPGQKSNYWETVDPVRLTVTLDGSAPSGNHEIQAKLTYFFCVPESGFCAPKRMPVTIPIAVE